MQASLFLLVFELSRLSAAGCRLEYEIKYGPMVLGSMVLEELPAETLAEIECYHFRAQLQFDGPLSFLFWANYFIESWCEKKNMLTVRSYKKTIEKNYRAEWSAIYEPGVVSYSDGSSYPLPDSARDMLTLWFFLRTLNWEGGKEKVLYAHIDRRNWQVSFALKGKQIVRTPAGKFHCLVVAPRTSGPLGTVFISDDARRLPVVIRTRVGGFPITAYLTADNSPPRAVSRPKFPEEGQ
ncbi:MAG: DUF3108 domain-containing protein [candidate division WOR-3 bacterium]